MPEFWPMFTTQEKDRIIFGPNVEARQLSDDSQNRFYFWDVIFPAIAVPRTVALDKEGKLAFRAVKKVSVGETGYFRLIAPPTAERQIFSECDVGNRQEALLRSFTKIFHIFEFMKAHEDLSFFIYIFLTPIHMGARV